MKYLIVLTDKYPFGEGESFIEIERDSWGVFDHVYICPVIATKNDTLRNGFKCRNNESLIENIGLAPTKMARLSGMRGGITYKDFLMEVNWLCLNHKLSCLNLKKLAGCHINTNLRTKRLYKALMPLLNVQSSDSILLYSYWMYEPVMVGIGLKRLYGNVRLITRAHGYDLYEERHRSNYIPYRELTFNNTDTIYTISGNGMNYLNIRTKGNYSDKILVSRLGTIRHYNINHEKTIADDEILIVSCAYIAPVKRIELIIEALKLATRNIRWVHFGGGEQEKKIKDKAQLLPSNVKYEFMGSVSNHFIQKFYADNYIDCFVNVSESEGIPVSIMEAQSYGIPVIATDVGGTSELVHDRINGVLLPVNFNLQDLLDAIEIVLFNASYYRRESENTWHQLSDASEIYRNFFERETTLI